MKTPYLKIDNFGSLYIDKIYVEGDVPIFFMCVDEDGRSYFVSASIQTNEYVSWVATEVSENRISDVLFDRISLQKIYINSEKNKIFYIKRRFHSFVTTFELFQRDQIDLNLIPIDEPLELSEEEKLSLIPTGQLNAQQFASKFYSSISKIHLENESIYFDHAVPAGLFGEFISDLQELKASLLLKASEVASRVTDKLKKSTQEYMVAINPGSFEVILQSEQSVLLDNTLVRIYSALETLMRFGTDNEEFRSFVAELNITAIKKYKKVLDDLISLGQRFEINTTFPEIDKESMVFLTKLTRSDIAIRRQLIENLTLKEDHIVQLKGELDGIDAIKRTFSFTQSENHNVISGKITSELADAVMNHEDLYHIPSTGIFYLTETITTDVNESYSIKRYSLTQFVKE
ncbi:MAG: DUF6575 domain-containing protein [Saccharofermentanales bacterium]